MLSTLSADLQKPLDHFAHVLGTLQTGRAHTALLEHISVEQYGAMAPIKTCANVGVIDAQTLRVEPWDKSIIGNLEKAISQSDLGLNPNNMGTYLLVPIPPMTEERRVKLTKLVKEEAENARVSVRNIRQDYLKQVKNAHSDKLISEDEMHQYEKDIQAEIDTTNEKIESMAKAKNQDILG